MIMSISGCSGDAAAASAAVYALAPEDRAWMNRLWKDAASALIAW